MIEQNIKEETPKKKPKVEQLVIERAIKLSTSDKWADVNNDIQVWASGVWINVIDKYKKYDIKKLLESGYKIISMTKAFCGGEVGRIGIETAILERETYE